MPKNKSSAPKISVILSSYNHENYIAQAIQSVLDQTFSDFELLIYDDGSKDNSREIIKSFDDPRIKTFLYKENHGPRIAAQEALDAARGKYIAIHHSDDVWKPDKLEKQFNFLETHREYVACFSYADFVDEEGNLRELDDGDFYKKIFEQPNRSRAEWLRYFFHNANCLCHPSVLIQRRAYFDYDLLDITGLWQLPDLSTWINLCFHADFYIMPEKLVDFRLRRESRENMSASNLDKRIRVETEMFFILSKFVEKFRNDKFFLEVFPEAEKFIVKGKIVREFAFAQICLENSSTAFPSAMHLVGINLLKKILSDKNKSDKIKKFYGYDEKSFLVDTGKRDIFGLRQKLSTIHAIIYADTGGGFNETEKIDRFVLVEPSGKFFAKYNYISDKPVKFLRFDPAENFVSIKLDSFKINGRHYENPAGNFFEIKNDFYRFMTPDPQLVFEMDAEAGAAKNFVVEILGTIDLNYVFILEEEISKFIRDNAAAKDKISELQEINSAQEKNISELREINSAQEKNISELREINSAQEKNISELQEINSAQEKNISELQEINSAQEKNISELKRINSAHEEKLAELQGMNIAKEQIIAELTRTNRELNDFKEAVLNSNSWKATEPLRNIGQWVRGNKKDEILSVAKSFYKALPFDEETKVSLKNKFYKNLAPFIKNTYHYKVWQNSLNSTTQIENSSKLFIGATRFKFDGEYFNQPGKIAIHAHIFYLDLTEEIVNYFSNMPYKFDALISVVDAAAEEKIRTTFEKIDNVENCIVRVVPNRGRDVAPFIVGFGDLIGNYDFIAHVHSKKSLYTGAEQKNWRQYLFDALIGSPERVRKIFRAFADNEKVGLIYPTPPENVPYQAFTWLSNQQIGGYLLNRLDVPPNKTDYFDFPAGTMFWARTSALKKFLQVGFTFEDFPAESGQNDGTLAHAFERAVSLTVNAEGMDFYEFSPADETYTVNIGGKNLWQYWSARRESDINWIIERWEIISFDIFDTLIMRYVAKPNLVNDLIAIKVEELLGRKFDFKKIRLQAENNAREKKSGDVNFDEIYESFAALTNFDEETCKNIRELEISVELGLILPREKIVAWLNRAVASGKKVWLISDMYLQKNYLERLLKRCGVVGYEKLMISCETGMRKDTAAVWNYLVEKNFVGKLIHIGDNETSDYQKPMDRKFDSYHVMSSINLFSQTLFGRIALGWFGHDMSTYAGIFLGIILAKKFNDPFLLKNRGDGGGKFQIKTFRELGYIFYGTPLLTFMLWLIKKSKADGIKRILFLARDGYFLQPLYKLVTKLLKIEELPNNYFYASRRAVTVASIREISHAEELLKLIFIGTTKKFFDVRFDLELGDDTEIHLPEEPSTKIMKKIMDEHEGEILERAALERRHYEKYLAGLGNNFDNVGVVDMGYAGTIQFYLQRLLGKNLTGYYFATNVNNRFGVSAAERMRGCFTENDDYGLTTSAIYKYHLLFESILTAPDAQLKFFDEEGNPIFGNPEPAQFQIGDIREVHEGISAFCRDVLEIFGEYILKIPIDFDFVDKWVRSFVDDEEIIAPEVKNIFNFDDEYCNTFTGNAFDLYLHGLNGINFKLK